MPHLSSLSYQDEFAGAVYTGYLSMPTPARHARCPAKLLPERAPAMPKLHRPHVIAIGSLAQQQRHALRAARFALSSSLSLAEGYLLLCQKLAPNESPRPLIVLVDLTVSEPNAPEWTAALLIAALARQMRRDELRTAWLIGIAPGATAALEAEAQVAGFHHIVTAPLAEDDLATLHELAAHVAPVPHAETSPEVMIAVEAYQRTAQRVIDAILAVSVPLWTSDDVQAVLSWLTRYPSASGGERLRQPNAQIRQGLRRLGGPHAAYERLAAMAAHWQERYPLYGAILDRFLTGYERREIVKQFVDEGFYEDSRIYACIKQLPERIAAELRLEQVTSHDPDRDQW
jgi:hypothetical protein